MNRTKFTIIELLVVAAIMAILTSLLMPALSKARKQATLISCSGNMKQIALMTAAYNESYDGYMPFTFHLGDASSYWFCVFSEKPLALARCYPSFLCPGNPALNLTPGYAYNVWFGYYPVENSMIPREKGIKLSAIQLHSKKLYLMEGAFCYFRFLDLGYTSDYSASKSYSFQPAYINGDNNGVILKKGIAHSTKANSLFVDGHVASMSFQEILGANQYHPYTTELE